MNKVTVKIRHDIAVTGGGFVDFAGKQEIFPRDKKGGIDPDKVFVLKATDFVEAKIGSGELVLLSREDPEKESSGESEKGKPQTSK